jgi:hypothetical protein
MIVAVLKIVGSNIDWIALTARFAGVKACFGQNFSVVFFLRARGYVTQQVTYKKPVSQWMLMLKF